ncbi:MAG: ribosomal L7Ae/L30e/S12e/Gadd45 family protein [Candidatus Nanoarchaeia archaeon]|nr:ribosomal L7Ae/L30e/S12e/Gadd45 family protein [Candidatus Nanoarchaeia archaeon]
MVKKQGSTNDVKKEIKSKKFVIGTNSVLKNLKLKKLEKIYIASNCSDKAKKDIEKYSKIMNVPLVFLKQPNDELGIVCKKQYSVSMLGILKE